MMDALEQLVQVPAGRARLDGELCIPASAGELVLFAHGSGSSRFSPRNRFVAQELQRAGFATLLIDLLMRREEELDNITAELRFDISMLGARVAAVLDWLAGQEVTRKMRAGLFGASTGAAAALIAAAQRPQQVAAVVSRGGRPDLAEPALAHVQTPTLLIVGGNDAAVIALNREALGQMHCEKRLAIVPGATHLFEEPGTLEQVAELACDWFLQHPGKTEEHAA